MKTFEELGVSPEIRRAIEEMGYEQPMPVQEEVIPYLLGENNDVVALAQTGTGKTAAYGLPLLQKTNVSLRAPQALILSPTRELCLQIAGDLNDYSKYIDGLRVLPVYGGSSIESQIRALKQGVHVIVATPGRLLDLMRRKTVSLAQVQNVVLDEADEMLNMGFSESIDAILAEVPQERNTLLFSATMSAEIARIAKNYLHDAKEITIGRKNEGTANVKHIVYVVHAKDKYETLKRIVDYNPQIYGIIFCRTRKETQEIADKLMQEGYNADALHGELTQAARDMVMQKFRIRNLQLLVATDVAARGIDVADISCVINYDLPQCPEDYIHRIGRTGRAGGTGTALSFVAEDTDKWKDICRVCRLGKLTELTKTDRPLPKPKFTPDAPRKKEKTSRLNESAEKKSPEISRPVLTEEKRKNAVSSLAKNTLQMSAPERKKKGLGLPKNKSKNSLSSVPAVSSVGETALRAGFRVVRAGGKKNIPSSVSLYSANRTQKKKHGGKTGKRQSAFSKFFKRKKH